MDAFVIVVAQLLSNEVVVAPGAVEGNLAVVVILLAEVVLNPFHLPEVGVAAITMLEELIRADIACMEDEVRVVFDGGQGDAVRIRD